MRESGVTLHAESGKLGEKKERGCGHGKDID